MAKVTNLNRFRKQKARAEKRRAGDENAARHGLSKAQKTLAKFLKGKQDRDLDGHARDDTDGA